MSLILEALRKSEAERRRGQAPGLFVEQRAVATRRRVKTPGWAWALIGVLALVLAAWGWREFGAERPEATVTPDTATDARPAATTEVTRPVHSTDPSLVPSTANPGEPLAPSMPSPPAPAAYDPPAPPASAPRTGAPPVAAAPAPAGTPETTEVASMQADSARPAGGDAIAATDLAAPAAAEPAAPQAPAPSPVTATAPEDERLPRLSELTGDERSNLPPLKLTMHVYADEPAQRFVILDGRRLREGESAASGIGVEAIRRDGLVLSVNGRRVLLARP